MSLGPRRLRPARCPFAVFLFAATLRHETLALVQPHLDTDLPVCRARFGEAVIDVRAERLQGELAVEVPFRARDLRAVQPSRDAHLDATRAEAQRRLDGLAHRPAERHALFELHRHRLRDELRVELWFLDLLNIDEDLAVGPLLDFLLQLVDFGPLAADDDAGPRGIDVDLQLVGGALGFDLGNARVCKSLLQRGPQL